MRAERRPTTGHDNNPVIAPFRVSYRWNIEEDVLLSLCPTTTAQELRDDLTVLTHQMVCKWISRARPSQEDQTRRNTLFVICLQIEGELESNIC